MESKITKKQGTKALPKGYIFIGLLFLLLVEYLSIVFWGLKNIFFTILKSYIMGLNFESISGSTQVFLMLYDFAENWLTVPLTIIYFVGIPVLCYFLRLFVN